MNILMVNKFLGPRGGAERCMLTSGSLLAARGHRVSYFGMEDAGNVVGNESGLYARHRDFHRRGLRGLVNPAALLYSWDARAKMKKIIEAFRPDVVHLHNIHFQLTPSVIDAAFESGVPVVQTVHDTQMLCPSHMMADLASGHACSLCITHGRLSCVRRRCIHGSLAKSLLGAAEGALYARLPQYDRVARYICPSRYMEGLLLRTARFAGKTLVIPNCAALPPIPPGEEKGRYVLYFGRLSAEKGIARLLEIFRLLPDVPLIVAGSGPLEEEVIRCGLPNVRYAGFLQGEALARLIAQAALTLCLPLWRENCPMAVIESMALGTPVLASREGGLPELIEEGVTGMLLDDASAHACARAIGTLFADTEALRTMSRACLKARSRRMTPQRYTDELLGVYRAVL